MTSDSRPPRFDMSYRPERNQSFGPPIASWIFPATYFAASALLLVIVFAMFMQTSGEWLFRYVVEADGQRVIGARPLAVFAFLGSVAAVVRTAMRGVLIHPEGIESRDMMAWVWPRVDNVYWAEIDEVILDAGQVALALRSGRQLWLPAVRDGKALVRSIEELTQSRGIPLRKLG